MIHWGMNATQDMIKIQNFNAKMHGIDTAVDIDTKIRAVTRTLDKPMNLSKRGRLGIGERERLVDIDNKKNEYIVVFDDDEQGNIEILNVKHHLEQYP
jgi:plasmid stabilization system protein ParE